MPRTMREIALRKIDQTLNLLDKSGGYMEELRVVYEKAHPEISEYIAKMQRVVIVGIEGMTAIRKKI